MGEVTSDTLTYVRDGFMDVCRDHLHDISANLAQSTLGLYRLGQRLNDKFSIRSRRLLHSRPTEDDIAYQAKILCRDYAYVKLRKHKLLSRDIYSTLNERKLRFLLEDEKKDKSTGRSRFLSSGPADVSKELIRVASELEKCFPYLYEDISDQLQLNFQPPANIQNVYQNVASVIFRKGITWARIVALYTLTGVLIVECVKQGHEAQANTLVDNLQKFVRKRLASWVIDQGGWVGLVVHFRRKHSSLAVLSAVSFVGVVMGVAATLWTPR